MGQILLRDRHRLPICFSRGGDTDGAMLLQLDPGSLHFYVTVGNKARAYFAIDGIGAGAAIFAGSIYQRSLEIIADWTMHNFPLRSFDRTCEAEIVELQRCVICNSALSQS
jgi:hypothetical protein